MDAKTLTTKFLSLYNRDTPNIDAVIDEIYHPEAIFIDPLVEVHGRDKIAAQFRVFPALMAQSEASILRGSVAENSILSIESVFTCRLKPLPKYFGCTFRMFSILEVQDLKIVSHIDHWDLRSVVENIPLMSSIYPKFRYMLGNSSSRLISAFIPRIPVLPQELLQIEESKGNE